MLFNMAARYARGAKLFLVKRLALYCLSPPFQSQHAGSPLIKLKYVV